MTSLFRAPKPICQWFAKGNCKFGHKCALAHVLPGQPMSFDRKNKRAAQQALREAQGGAGGVAPDGGALVTAAHATAQSPRLVDGSGLVQTLRQSADYGGTAARLSEFAMYQQAVAGLAGPGIPPNGAASSSGASQGGDVDAIFGSPDSVGAAHRTPAGSPALQHRTLQHESPHSPLHFSTIQQGPTATFIAPAASGLSHHFGAATNGGGASGRSTVAAQAMLSEQARRLSSTSESLSPPRLAMLSRSRLSFNSGSPGADSFLPSSPPLAVPGTAAGGAGGVNGATSIFGTSPFSGSRGLFIPSSYDSNEDGAGFPRSPPVRPSMLAGGEMHRSGSGRGLPWQDAIEDDNDEDDEDGAGELNEGFLPSSLNDLLTPEEMRRRTQRVNGTAVAATHAPSSLSTSAPFDPFLLPPHPLAFNSQSVPAELLLAAGKPPFTSSASAAGTAALAVPQPTLGARSASTQAVTSFGLLSSSVEGHNPSARPYEPGFPNGSGGAAGAFAGSGGSLLSQSRTREATIVPTSPAIGSSASNTTETPPTSSLLSATLNGPLGATAGIYSASYSDPPVPPPSSASPLPTSAAAGVHARYAQTGLSPGTNALLAAPGSSLPGGLAAGLSRLHLVPPRHTGETPPGASSLLSEAGLGGAGGNGGPPPGSALARRMSGHAAAAAPPPLVASPLQNELHPDAAAPRRPALASAKSGGEGSVGGGDLDEVDVDDGIQFDMEVA
ncbi:hypothetical protein Rhopal_002232-T1 [Rhodotorula paludigena]|uniref:C3H1-type domain-containing protein n=1 Tax=Rhodotorula paludigena TaxID=86838 RepID=A0AAV5GGF6_9BASI|nr:hypothetical protein Rhopal_002232-T1 [Rhodotorula paludigena]